MKYKHYLITRFNLRVQYGCKLKDPDNNPMLRIFDDDYLEERFDIFEKYTLPSVKNQINQNFTWVVLFHKNTPNTFLNRINELEKTIFHLTSVPKMRIMNFILQVELTMMT